MNEKLINILLNKIDELEKEIEHDKIYINSLETKNVRLIQVNKKLENKLNDIKKLLDVDCCVESIYQAICQYLNVHDYELNLSDFLKEN